MRIAQWGYASFFDGPPAGPLHVAPPKTDAHVWIRSKKKSFAQRIVSCVCLCFRTRSEAVIEASTNPRGRARFQRRIALAYLSSEPSEFSLSPGVSSVPLASFVVVCNGGGGEACNARQRRWHPHRSIDRTIKLSKQSEWGANASCDRSSWPSSDDDDVSISLSLACSLLPANTQRPTQRPPLLLWVVCSSK